MSLYEFKKNEVIKNTLVAHPKISFRIKGTNIYFNNVKLSVDVPEGNIHINDYNIDNV